MHSFISSSILAFSLFLIVSDNLSYASFILYYYNFLDFSKSIYLNICYPLTFNKDLIYLSL